MRGIILAAGKGIRLNGTTGNTPKCLLEIGDCTLLERQMQTLKSCGIRDITVVVGYQSERVRKFCEPETRIVENSIYEKTNSLFSLWLAREYLSDGFVVLNSDVLFHPRLLTNLLESSYKNALLMEPVNRLEMLLGDEEMKVKVEGERVIEINKTMKPDEADGENLGIVKFGKSDAPVLVNIMDALISGGCLRDWAPRAFGEFATMRHLNVIGTAGLPWIEIDYPEDYQKALHEILPNIETIKPASQTGKLITVGHQARVAEIYS
ncbi:MAG: phosphocholine cytidylyltransferase family protein [Acidobacteriota bacterium]